MRNTLTALLSAASIAAFAGVVPAAAQAIYGTPWPYGVQSDYSGPVPTVPSHTGTPAYSYEAHNDGPYPAATGSCSIIAGNRVCTATPAYGSGYGYGAYGPGPGGLIGAAVGAPFAAAGALAAAPFEATAALTGAPYAVAGGTYAPAGAPTIPSATGAPLYSYHHVGPRPAAVGGCDVIAGNRVCNTVVP